MSTDKNDEAHSPPAPAPPAAPAGPTIDVRATWVGEHRFETGRVAGPAALFDGSSKLGQNPVDALISSLASCIGIDVVDILVKRRTPADRCVVDAHAQRRAAHPRRIERAMLTFRVDGAGVEVEHTERAVALSIEKYCSVSASLAPHVVIETTVIANGVAGTPVSHPRS